MKKTTKIFALVLALLLAASCAFMLAGCNNEKPETPDADADALKAAFEAYTAKYGYKPKVVFIEKLGMFAIGDNVKAANTVTTSISAVVRRV